LRCDRWKDAENELFANQEQEMVKRAVRVNASMREAQLAFRDVVANDCYAAVAGSFLQ